MRLRAYLKSKECAGHANTGAFSGFARPGAFTSFAGNNFPSAHFTPGRKAAKRDCKVKTVGYQTKALRIFGSLKWPIRRKTEKEKAAAHQGKSNRFGKRRYKARAARWF
jgi:hypothetical protein